MFVRRFLVATLSLLGLMSFAAPSLRAADKPDKIVVSGARPARQARRQGVTAPRRRAQKSHSRQPHPRRARRIRGVKHIVYTSYIGADKGESPAAADHQQSENYLRASGAKWTLLRNGFYADIHVAAAIEMAKTGRTTLRPNEPQSAPVTRADCAAAAAGALLNPSLSENQAFDITGPELYNRRDVVEAVSAMTGKSIEVIEAPEPPRDPAGSRPGPGAAGSTIPIGPPPTTPPVVSDAVVNLAGRPAMGLKVLLDANKEQILAAAKGS